MKMNYLLSCLLIGAAALSAASCKKTTPADCYVCDHAALSNGATQVCKTDTGDEAKAMYYLISSGGAGITDPTGNYTLHCSAK